MKKQSNLKWNTLTHWGIWVLVLLSLSSCNDDGTLCIKGKGAITSRSLQLSPIREIETNGDFIVYVTQGAQQQVEVNGEPNILDELSTTVQNGKWKIEFRSCVRRSKPVKVSVTMPEVASLSVNGSGKIYGQNKITTNDLAVAVNGSGSIELELTATKVIARVIGSGEMKLTGETKQQHVNLAGSGKVNAFDLAAEDVRVNLAGSGKAEVAASKTLDVDLSGSGNVFYRGAPTIYKRVSGSGKVVQE